MRGSRALTLALAAFAWWAVAAPLAGCGDDPPATEPAPVRPQLTVPGEEPGSPRARPPRGADDTGAGRSPEPAPDPTPSTSSTTPEAPSDGPSNDTPPASGSPADRFESACREDPQACR